TEDLELDYRRSAFTRGTIRDRVVLSVDLRLERGDSKTLRERLREFDEQRRAAQPPGRNCGSVFKNPLENPSWWYIEQAGLRGHTIGKAQVSEPPATCILNLGGARAARRVPRMQLGQTRVQEETGVALEPEV